MELISRVLDHVLNSMPKRWIVIASVSRLTAELIPYLSVRAAPNECGSSLSQSVHAKQVLKRSCGAPRRLCACRLPRACRLHAARVFRAPPLRRLARLVCRRVIAEKGGTGGTADPGMAG